YHRVDEHPGGGPQDEDRDQTPDEARGAVVGRRQSGRRHRRGGHAAVGRHHPQRAGRRQGHRRHQHPALEPQRLPYPAADAGPGGQLRLAQPPGARVLGGQGGRGRPRTVAGLRADHREGGPGLLHSRRDAPHGPQRQQRPRRALRDLHRPGRRHQPPNRFRPAVRGEVEPVNTPDLNAAAEAVEVARAVCRKAAAHLAELSSDGGRISVARLDRHQVLAYDLAHATAGVEGAAVMCDYGNHGGLEARLACLFTAEAIADLVGRLVGREAEWGVSAAELSPAGEFVNAHRAPGFAEDVAEEVARHGGGNPYLGEEFELVRDTFHRFAAEKVRPVAEEVHRHNLDIPETVIGGLAEIGGFGLSVPEEYGGFAAGGESDYLGMVIATEELSWGSLGVGGSLITRPEILTRALVRGGTEEQKKVWLPRIAAGEAMVGVMVTEPDYGSDVANLKVTATPTDGGYRINGVKTWATFAGRANTLMLLARTDPDRSKGHKGLSLFVVEKPEAPGHHFEFTQDNGGKMEGRAIDTLGYRGMPAYEVSFGDWFGPAANLIGGEGGLGKGFYYQMEGFENGRLQTAARAVGLMQAAYEAALDY